MHAGELQLPGSYGSSLVKALWPSLHYSYAQALYNNYYYGIGTMKRV